MEVMALGVEGPVLEEDSALEAAVTALEAEDLVPEAVVGAMALEAALEEAIALEEDTALEENAALEAAPEEGPALEEAVMALRGVVLAHVKVAVPA